MSLIRRELSPVETRIETKKILLDKKLAQTKAGDVIEYYDFKKYFSGTIKGGKTSLLQIWFEAEKQENVIVDFTYELRVNGSYVDCSDPSSAKLFIGNERLVYSDSNLKVIGFLFEVGRFFGESDVNISGNVYARATDKGSLTDLSINYLRNT